MPYINVRVAKEETSPEKKAELIEEITSLVARVLGKNPATTNVVIDEVDPENWGVGGKTVKEIRKEKAA